MRHRSQLGMSIIEVCVVTLILVILAAILLPNLMKARLLANETVAISDLRLIQNSASQYAQVCGSVGFPSTLAALSVGNNDCTSLGLINNAQLTSGTNSSYVFTYAPSAVSGVNYSYVLNADPLNTSTGIRHFYTDQSCVIHYTFLNRAATVLDPIL
jgi:type IV pilus assembly protein PilA